MKRDMLPPLAVLAVILAFALWNSAAITGYLWCFAHLMRRVFSCSRVTAGVYTVLFLALHFLKFLRRFLYLQILRQHRQRGHLITCLKLVFEA